jgi:hypothetical protein
MTVKELNTVKRYQREFYYLFNKRLEIDWNMMKGIVKFERRANTINEDAVSLDVVLDGIINKNGANLDAIKSKRLTRRKYPKEQKALREFSVYVMDNRLNVEEAGKLINKDRSGIYYYAGRR